MKGLRQQRGMGLYSIAMLLVLIAFLSVIIIRLFPMYLNNFKIETHITEIANNPETHQMSKAEIRETLGKRFAVDGVEHINLRENIKIETSGKMKDKTIKVDYEAKVKLFYNLSVIAEFRDFEAKVVRH